MIQFGAVVCVTTSQHRRLPSTSTPSTSTFHRHRVGAVGWLTGRPPLGSWLRPAPFFVKATAG
jgi:hypothetical protein